jgi:hypothetical protein
VCFPAADGAGAPFGRAPRGPWFWYCGYRARLALVLGRVWDGTLREAGGPTQTGNDPACADPGVAPAGMP